MPRLSSYPPALVGPLVDPLVGPMTAVVSALVVVLVLVPGAPVAAAPATDPDPLLVDISSLQPATVPPPGEEIRITGTVTNQSTEEWTSINLHAFTSDTPITTSEELEAAAATAPDEYVGDRITAPGTFDTVDSLLPGETAEFVVEVPRAALDIPDAAGVYWIGVHALGDASEPRDGFADGRARTFVPLVPEPGRRERREPVRSALVVPMVSPVRYTAEGRVDDLDRWTQTLADGGRLERLVELAETLSGRQVTWLVDPAVLDAVARIAAGNPERTLAPPPEDEGPDGSDEPGGPTDSGTPDEEDAADGTGDSGGSDGEGNGSSDGPAPASPTPTPADELTPEQQEAAEVARAWLDRFLEAMDTAALLALPYADLDVSAAAVHAPDSYRRALRRSRQVMAALDLEAKPAIVSRRGPLSREAIAQAPRRAVVLLADDAAVGDPAAGSAELRIAGRDVLVTSSGAAAGGPGPTDPQAPLALRQRLLGEAAIRLADADAEGVPPTPIVTMLPHVWSPLDAERLFRLRSVPWLEPVEVDDLVGPPRARANGEVRYTAANRAAQLDAISFATASRLVATADILDGILVEGSTVRSQVVDEALTTLSHSVRDRPELARARARAAESVLRGQLASITVETPSSVTLSSSSGSLGATVVNELDQPVEVRVEAITGPDLEVTEPDSLRLAPESRTRLILEVTAARTGIHDVRLVVTDAQGRRLGASASVPIRAAEVSQVIWFIMAGGAALLFGAIAVRLVRRVREARR